MLLMTCPEEHGVIPAQKAIDVEKPHVQGSFPKHRLVTQLMEAVHEKGIKSSMQEEQSQHDKQGKMPYSIPG
jgi:hypothetical protein